MKYELKTRRTHLRRLNQNDFSNLRQLESDADVVRYTRIKTPRTEVETQTRLNDQIQRNDGPEPYGIWAVESADLSEFIGWFMLVSKPNRSAEIGYMIVKKFWGQGFATEVCRCLVEAGFNTLNLASVQAVTEDANPASAKILENIGFQLIRREASESLNYFELKNRFWQPSLHGKLLKTEPLQSDQFEELYQVASDPLIWKVHPNPLRYQRDVFQKFFDSGLERHGALLIKTADGKRVIGSSSFYEYNHYLREVVIGYTFLSREYWGGNYNKELKKLMLEYAFKFVDTVYFDVGEKNIRSQKALDKIGAQLVKKITEPDPRGQIVLTLRYQIHRADYDQNPYWKRI
ncbi:MAG: hypothetical protein B7Y39_14340 [Bdellovibrio sp. 28-41-41]|nr:MAG: hypothetical protein B7Y39_14340 [Bdellovibrio sp. 28-41-41]